MVKIIYTRQGGVLECVKITGAGFEAHVVLDEPRDAELIIYDRICTLKSGEGYINLSGLPVGAVSPVLRQGKRSEKMGKIRITPTGVSHNEPDFDYVRELSARIESLAKRVCALEEENERLKKRVYGTHIF